MEKILFLGAGSENDPGFEDVQIDKKPFREYMGGKGITVTDPHVIESCHRCPDIMQDYSEQLQALVEEGHRVVGVLQGGLFFALPSIQAAQTTFPIISCPLDTTAYQAFMVPSGHAAIASVGIETRKKDGTYFTSQRKKALRLAERILNLTEDRVTISYDDDSGGEVGTEIDKYNINRGIGIINNGVSLLHSTEGLKKADEAAHILLWADDDKNPRPYLPADIREHVTREEIGLREFVNNDYNGSPEFRNSQAKNTLQVRGVKNLAVFATKILSLQRPDIRSRLKKIAEDKRERYGTPRILKTELRL